MKHRSKILLPAGAAIADLCAVMLGVWLSYLVRFSEWFTQHIPIVTALPPFGWYLIMSLILGALTMIYMIAGKLYDFPREEGYFDELVSVIGRYIAAFTLLLAGLFFYREVTFSRVALTMTFFLGGLSLAGSRFAGRGFRKQIYRFGIAVRRAAVVGSGSQADFIVEHLAAHREFGLVLIGNIGDDDHVPDGLRHLGTILQAGNAVEKHNLDTLIIAPAANQPDTLPALVKSCYGVNVDFLYLPDIHPVDGRPKRIVEMGGIPLWTLKVDPFSGWNGVVKRVVDFVVSAVLLVLLLPILLFISLLIKINSPGSILYRQGRVGFNGKYFMCLKFRSMRINAEKDTGPKWATADDSRTTGVGKFLRRWSLDELPQLWNVLRGDMSLVGPRPERPEFVQQFEQRIVGYNERHRVKAGLTGWAQVNGLRGVIPIEDRTKFDRYYIENWSPLLDIKILFLTILAVFKGENAY